MEKILLLLALTLCIACSTNAPKEKCKFGQPTAIFSSTIPTVAQHQFHSKTESVATEKIVFDSGKELEITQSGCNSIQQELLFRLKNKPISSDPELFALGIQELDALGKLSDKLKPFSFWAQAIYNQADALKKGMEIELEPNTYASIDLIEEGNDALIRIVLSQK